MPVALGDRLPVVDRGAAEGVDADPQLRAGDGVHVEDVRQVGDVGSHEVVLARGRGAQRLLEGHALHVAQAALEDRVGPRLDRLRDVGAGRAAVGRVVLEAAVVGRVVRGRDDDAVGEVGLPAAVPGQDRVRDRRRRRVAPPRLDPHLDPVGGEDLERGGERRLGERVGVHAEEERARDAPGAAVLDEGLARGEDVVLVEAAPERRAAVAGGPEGDALSRVRRVGLHDVVRRDEARDVDEEGAGGGLAGELVQRHQRTSGCRAHLCLVITSGHRRFPVADGNALVTPRAILRPAHEGSRSAPALRLRIPRRPARRSSLE